MKLNASTILKGLIIAIAGWIILATNLAILIPEYPGFWVEFPPYHPGGDDDKIFFFLAGLFKVFWLSLLAGYILFVADWTSKKKYKATRWLDGYYGKLVRIIRNNWSIARQYHKGMQLVFILWVVLMIIVMLTIPYHYDESWSYHYFSSHGWLRTMTFYPLPNNHIFFNLVAVCFIKLPLNPVITTRLPSLFASFVSFFYFLKLCREYFSEDLALFLSFLLCSTFPFIMYGIEGRGYGLTICFSILQLYAANQLVLQYRSLKYRLLYFFAFAAGLYTVPSYLYFVFPVHVLLFVYILRQKGWRIFIMDTLKTTAILVILYWLVIYCNGSKVLFSPNDTVRLSGDKLIPAIREHLKDAWSWLTDDKLAFPLVLLILLAPPADLIRRIKKNSWLNWVVFLLLISPPFILFLHRVIPFARTWTHLIVPIVLGFGFLISLTARFLTKYRSPPRLRRAAVLYPGALAVLLLVDFVSFQRSHRRTYGIDYTIGTIFRKIRPEIAAAKTIYSSRQSMEFYATEQLVYQRAWENPDRPLEQFTQDSSINQDILILNPSLGVKEVPQLVNYQLAGSYPNAFSIYTKK